MNARDIIREAYGQSKNFMTPDVLEIVSIKRGRIAAEISTGTGLRGETIYGVSVAGVVDGKVKRMYEWGRCCHTRSEVTFHINWMKELSYETLILELSPRDL